MLFFRILQPWIERISHTAHAVLVESTNSTSRCAEFGASSLSFRKVGEHQDFSGFLAMPTPGRGPHNTGTLTCGTVDSA
jgi:hypothetical protein